MVAVIRGAHWLGAATLLLVGSGCGEDGLLTRPSALSVPVTSCVPAGSQRGLRLPLWDLFVIDRHWDALHDDVTADVEVGAQLCIAGVLEPIRLELQGNSSRRHEKRSFKIKFEREHELTQVGFDADENTTIDKVYLKAFWSDQSLVREAVAFDLWREMGHKAPRTGFANLRINGDYWGLYAVVEPVDDDYLERNGYPAEGHLYKATRKHGSRADFEPGRDLDRAFEDKSDKEGTRSRKDLEHLVRMLQETPVDEAAFARDIDPIFPLDDYIERLVWVALTRNGDAVAQNFFLYNAPRNGRDRWYQIPWDSNLCMGASWRDRDAVVPPGVSLLLDGGNYFGRKLTSVPRLRERYADRFRQVLDEVLTEDVLLHHLERRAARVAHDLVQDQHRWQRNVTPDQAFDVIREFLLERPAVLRQGLDTFAPPKRTTPSA